MPDRLVTWRAVADFSKVRQEAAKTQASLAALQAEIDEINASNSRLGASEQKLGRDLQATGSKATSVYQAVAASRTKAEEASHDLTQATTAETNSTTANTKAVVANNTARLNEAKSAQRVTSAKENLAQANARVENTEKKLNTALNNQAKLQALSTSTAKELEAAQNKVETATERYGNALNAQRKAVNSATSAELNHAKVIADNTVADQKAADAAVANAERRARAAQKSADSAAAAAKKASEDQIKAQNASVANAEKAAYREEAARQRVVVAIERQIHALRTAQQAEAAAVARGNAPVGNALPTPGQVVPKSASTFVDVSQAKSALAAKQAENSVTERQITLADQLAAREATLRGRMDEEISRTNILTNVQNRLAQARAVESALSTRVAEAESEVSRVRADSGSSTLDILQAETELSRARAALTNQSTLVRSTTTAEVEARNRLTAATHDTENAERRLGAAARDLNNDLKSSSGGGNIFSKTLNLLFGEAENGGSAFASMGSALGSIKWPVIAGAVYILLGALSALIDGLFALGSAIAPAVGGLAAALPVVFSLAGAFGVLKLAFSGISGVLKSYQASQLAAVTGGAKLADQTANNADAIISAQEQVANASHQIQQAQKAEKKSIDDLNQARKDALKNILALKQAVIDAALAEEGATLDLADAKDALQKTLNDPTASANDIARAKLAVANAQNQANVDKKASNDSVKASDDATNAGVEGAKSVIDAKNSAAEATYNVTKAEQSYADALRQLAKAQRTANTSSGTAATAAARYNALLAKLPKSGQNFVKTLISMKKYWIALRTTASNNLFPGLTKAVKMLPSLMPVFQGVIKNIAGALGDVSVMFAKAFTSDSWKKSFTALGNASRPIIMLLAKSLLNIINIIRGVAVAAIPMTKTLLAGFQAWTSHGAAVTNSASGYKRMLVFFQKSVSVLHQLGQIIKNVGTGFFNMGKAASGSGKSMLDSIQNITKRWSDWTKSTGKSPVNKASGATKGNNKVAGVDMGENIVAPNGQKQLKDFFEQVRKNLVIIDGFLGKVIRGFFKLGGSKFFTNLLGDLKVVGSALGNNSSGIGKSLSDLARSIAGIITTIGKNSGGGIAAFVGTLDLLFGALNSFLKLPGVGPAISAIITVIGGFKAIKFFSAITGITGLTKSLRTFFTVEKEATGLTGFQSLKKGLAGFATGVKNLPGNIKDGLSSLKQLAGGARDAGRYMAGIVTSKLKSGISSIFGTLSSLGKNLAAVGKQALIATGNFIKMVAASIISGLATVASSIVGIGKAFLLASKAFLTNPIVLAIVAIIAVIYLLVTHWKDVWGLIKDIWNLMLSVGKAIFTALIQVVITPFKIIYAVVKALVVGFWNYLKAYWNFIVGLAKAVFKLIADIITGKWGKLWGDVKKIFGVFWTFLQSLWKDVTKTAGSIWDGIVSAIGSAFGAIEGVFSKIWDNVKKIFADAINFITQDILDPLIGAINTVTGLFHIPAIPRIPKINTGSGGSTPSFQGSASAHATGGVLPGFTPGRDPHHFVSNTGLRINLSGGEGILTPETTRAIGGKRGIDKLNRTFTGRLGGGGSQPGQHYAGGGVVHGITDHTVGDFNAQEGMAKWLMFASPNTDKGFFDKVGGVIHDVVGLVRKGLANATVTGFKAMEAPIRLLTNNIPVPVLKQVTNGLFDKVNSGIYDLIAGNSKKKNNLDMMNYPGRAAADHKKNITASGLILNNMTDSSGITKSTYVDHVKDSNPAAWDALQSIIVHESNWDAAAVNRWDSNAAAGHPSQGLMQTIAGTYQAYKNPNMDRGMLDSISNVAAGVNYSNRRYGGLQNVPGVQAVDHGGKYVGYKDGGVLNFHNGGYVPGLWNGAADQGIAALNAQADVALSANTWNSTLQYVYKKRLAGVSRSQGVTNTVQDPHSHGFMAANDKRLNSLAYYMEHSKPGSYDTLWKGAPYNTLYGTGLTPSNPYHKMPLYPILAYASQPTEMQNFYNIPKGHEKDPAAINNRKTWLRELKLVQDAYTLEKNQVSQLRHYLGLGASPAAARGLWSDDMTVPADHAAAHALSLDHPYDWPHPWSGPVTEIEEAIATQDRGNAINAEWYADLNTLASWGMPALVQYLTGMGVSDGLQIARQAVTSRTSAQTLETSLEKGNGLTGDQNTQNLILQVLAKLGSGTATKPYGLRDISSFINVPDFQIVNLYDQMTAQLAAMNPALTGKFESDINLFREGLFYANNGGMVPGHGTVNKDVVPAMLTPKEGVLNRMAMHMIGGERTLNRLNNGLPAQAFANGGIVLSPNVTSPSLSSLALASSGRLGINPAKTAQSSDVPMAVTLETNIYNPTGENSVVSMNKNLRKQAITGVVAKAAGA